MSERELMTKADIEAFGVEIVHDQLVKDGWRIQSVNVDADPGKEPQITADKDGEFGFFVIRTDIHPGRGKFLEGQEAFNDLVRHARSHGATCYFASVGIANSEGDTDEVMSTPVKGVAYHVQFDGLIRMELPPDQS